MAVLTLLLLIILIAAYLFAPSKTITSLGFRLEFQGAENRRYPSGITFSTADIVATPILRRVYSVNQLGEFLSFQQFSAAVYVVEENDAQRVLINEYQSRLSDPRISAVDRARLEQEFQTKMESVARSSYSLNFTSDVAGDTLPADLLEKVLRDILKVWAEHATEEKGVVRYEFPMLTTSVLPPVDEEPIVAVDILRSRIWQFLRNIQDLRKIPGAEALRTREGASLAELELELDEVTRVYLRPLINSFREGRYLDDRYSAIAFIESQLDHVSLRLEIAKARRDALVRALSLYTESGRAPAGGNPEDGTLDTVAPQLGDTFLDRIVDLSGQGADRAYRQNLVDRIANESLLMVPYENEILFYQELLEDLRAGPVNSGQPESDPRSEIERARARVAEVVRQTNEIYQSASRNLNASRSLYTITRQMHEYTVRPLSAQRLALFGVLALLISLPLVLTSAVIYDRFSASRISRTGNGQGIAD